MRRWHRILPSVDWPRSVMHLIIMRIIIHKGLSIRCDALRDDNSCWVLWDAKHLGWVDFLKDYCRLLRDVSFIGFHYWFLSSSLAFNRHIKKQMIIFIIFKMIHLWLEPLLLLHINNNILIQAILCQSRRWRLLRLIYLRGRLLLINDGFMSSTWYGRLMLSRLILRWLELTAVQKHCGVLSRNV
jgi:hypothetical protein